MNHSKRLLFIVSIALATFGGSIRADEPLPTARVVSSPKFDGLLSDSQWANAKRISNFTDVAARGTARSQTEAAIYYDDVNVYVRFWCPQTAPLTATQTTNNSGFGSDDFVGVGIDPSGNAERAYYFEVTPLGTRYAQSSESTRYLPHWEARTDTQPGRWTAMLVIPLAAMKLPSSREQHWRVNLVRSIVATGEKLSTSYNVQMDSSNGFPNLVDARYWLGLQNIQFSPSFAKPKPSVDLYSLTALGSERTRFIGPDGTAFSRVARVAGVDATYPLTGTMSLVGTLNPDFSNVDADQVTISPQIFQRNLNEYRPFFAQGANYINNAATALAVNEPANVTFYSPSIGTFDRGLKLEGTYGSYQSLGLMDTSGTNDVTGDHFNDLAFGWKHVLPGRTFGYWTNGAIANHGSIHDSTVELATQARDLRTGWVGALFHESEFTRSPQSSYSSSSTYGFLDHQNDKHEALVAFRNISPQYRPIDGFTQLADLHGFATEYIQFLGGASGVIKSGTVDAFADRYLDGSGEVHKADAGITVTARYSSDIVLTLAHTQTEARSYDGNFFSGFPAYRNPRTLTFVVSSIDAALHPSSPSPLEAKYSWGPFGDFYLQQMGISGARALNHRMSASWEYDAARERLFSGRSDGQWLRRVSVAYSLGSDSSLSFGVRGISGRGGFADPGNNFSATLHRVFAGGNELYAAFGTPSASSTLNRFLLKYVFKSQH